MSNENIPAGQFKAQGGVGAFIKDFPLDIKYTVTSFTLTADDEMETFRKRRVRAIHGVQKR